MSSKVKDTQRNKTALEQEAALVSRAIEGDLEAFGSLVDLNQDRVFNLSFRLTGSRDKAWDLSQEGFMKAYAAIRNFKGGARFYTWVYRIVLNLHMNWEKSAQGKMDKRSFSMDAPGRSGENRSALRERIPYEKEGNPTSEVMRKERKAAVQKAISALPEDQRQVVLLRDMEGMPYEDIAKLLSVPVGTVRSRLHRGREELKNRLEGIL